MHAFSCPRCGQLVFFHNTSCLACDAPLAFDPTTSRIVVPGPEQYRCRNADLAACNWLSAAAGLLCRSCELTRTRPADDDAAGLSAFAVAEGHKRRVVFQLLALGLPVRPLDADGVGITFDLLSSRDGPVTTGHAGGVITIDLREVDDAHREQVRAQMDEPYRTVLGHIRHEVGHQQFATLVPDDELDAVRATFGDERSDYAAALDRHYAHGPRDGWEAQHVSAYATMHPAEDWAETFAHYLHLNGVLQTAAAYRLRVDGPVFADDDGLSSDPSALRWRTIEELVDAWLPLSYALNAITRSVGGDDLYPFVLPPPVVVKLGVVHRLVRRAAGAA